MRTELLEFRHITKTIGGHKVLHDLSLRLYQNEITFLVGGETSGKSLLAKLLMGQSSPDCGRITLFEKAYQPLSPEYAHEKGLFYITPETRLLHNLTIGENIGLSKPPFRVCWQYKRHMASYIQMVCDDCGIQLDLQKKAMHIKLIDMLQVHCARALLSRARLLIFDNILYLLSENDIQLFFEKLYMLKERGISVLILEPIERYALQYGDRTVFLSDGRVLADFLRGECSPEKAAAILCDELAIAVDRPKTTRAFRPPMRTFFYPTEAGIGSLEVGRGEILGISCHSAERYQWYLDSFFNTEEIRRLNDPQGRARLSVLTFRRLQSDYFGNLSLEENMVLPAYARISENGILLPGRHEKFFASELADKLPFSPEEWRKKLHCFDDREREMAVLYRTLMESTEFLVISGLTDQPNIALLDDIQQMIKLAAGQKKSILLFGRTGIPLHQWCDRLFYLDMPESPCV